jgi:short-subunit dehydrogenase
MTRAKNPIDYSDQTVLLTGASAGIGAEFARRLAGRGSDLVLVARRADRLESLAAELRGAHAVAVTTVPIDLAQPGIGEMLRTELANRRIDVTSVVNNAGFANHGLFHEEELSRLTAEIALDVSSVVEISHAFLPALRERGDGFLINVASMAAYVASPTMAVYGASKAFVLSFTEALWYESRDTGLRVMALSPGATQTEFFDVAGDAASGGARRVPASVVVDTAMNALDRGIAGPTAIVGGGNRMAAAVGPLLGRRRMTAMMGRLMAPSVAAG